MNRIIKFRFWDEINKKMLFCDFNSRIQMILSDLYENGMVMQYTNLVDKKSKEIYEGDIVKVYRGDDYLDEEYEDESEVKDLKEFNDRNALMCTQEVKMEETGSGYLSAEDDGEYRYGLGDTDALVVEIIGNIYENPNLLN